MSYGWENLEGRQYLAASLDPSTKLLTITGTSQSDLIRVAIAGVNLKVTIGGKSNSFPLKKVGSILIDALAGNDDVDINNTVKIPATIRGNQGNDALGGGGANDVIDGGAGADVIAGGPGIDLAEYSTRTAAVRLGIGGMADDGEAGEHDNIGFDIEQLAGGSGSDSINGSGANNTLIGNAGNDTITAAGGKDLLDGGDGNDSLRGQAGDDVLRGGDGDDQYFGGDGIDVADYSDHDTPLPVAGRSLQITTDDTADDGVYMNFVQVEFDNVHADVENVTGSNADDIIAAFDNTVHHFDGRAGNDLILGGGANDVIDAGVGDDSILAGGGDDAMIGGPETIAADQSDADYLQGDEGADSMNGGAGDDRINGGIGNDHADGGGENDEITGEVGADSLAGNDGNDTILGGIDNDTLDGGDGIDSLFGEDGDDLVQDAGTILPEESGEELGESGLDEADNLIDTLDAGTGADRIIGGDGQAFLIGGDGNDTISGGAGAENIDAGLGDDSIDAGAGNDFVNGQFGVDTMNGDAGNDVFANADGDADQVDGGDDLDLVQFEPAGTDSTNNVEGTYDQPEDDGEVTPGDTSEGEKSSGESRPMSAAAGPVGLINDPKKGLLLSVTGTSGNDDISLSQSGSTITTILNGTSYPIVITGVKGIRIDAGAGGDFVALATSSGSSTIGLLSTIQGGAGNDVLRGGNGPDSLIGGLGNDNLTGNKGDDYLNGGIEAAGGEADGTDTFTGGAGEDGVIYSYRTSPLVLTLDGVANDGAAGEKDLIAADIEDIFGGRGNDQITGNAGANYLSGGTGADVIHGGAGIDKIIANASKDRGDFVYGDAAKDVLVMAGDNVQDRYDVGLQGAFLNLDVSPEGTFLDTPI